jgi:hypothetical protein
MSTTPSRPSMANCISGMLRQGRPRGTPLCGHNESSLSRF